MATEDLIAEKVRTLPPEEKREVLDCGEFLEHRRLSKQPRKSALGMWAELNITLTDEDIAEARREMWATFPRDLLERN